MHEETISTCTPGPGRPVLDFTLTDTTTTTGNLNFTINSLFNAAFNRKTQRQGPQVHTIVLGREDAPFPALQSSTLQPPHFGCQFDNGAGPGHGTVHHRRQEHPAAWNFRGDAHVWR